MAPHLLDRSVQVGSRQPAVIVLVHRHEQRLQSTAQHTKQQHVSTSTAQWTPLCWHAGEDTPTPTSMVAGCASCAGLLPAHRFLRVRNFKIQVNVPVEKETPYKTYFNACPYPQLGHVLVGQRLCHHHQRQALHVAHLGKASQAAHHVLAQGGCGGGVVRLARRGVHRQPGVLQQAGQGRQADTCGLGYSSCCREDTAGGTVLSSVGQDACSRVTPALPPLPTLSRAAAVLRVSSSCISISVIIALADSDTASHCGNYQPRQLVDNQGRKPQQQ